MGQYHYVVNFSKREFIDPKNLGIGLKAYEQLCSQPSTPHALFILLLCSNGRGGGDLEIPKGLDERVLGRWSGDRIAVVGDYAEDDDIPGFALERLSTVYDQCRAGGYRDISALVRPVLAAEFDLEYYSQTLTLQRQDNTTSHYEYWNFKPKANHFFISVQWHVQDVLSVRPDLTHDQAIAVLESFQCLSPGKPVITWDIVKNTADTLFPVEASTATD